ncbi:CIC11C00000004419 [Sungouiella intermedia]|uniref:CIC11C00000000883 n=1 Tax=Sungouiella intermedia TaxID=45354 RepID=A0A1L0B6G4_9ASCO|nr:CIC11C00000004419 [[Candida] intermedia]SGZ50839.1 CIC11C00000000883 [[Candida] intermedia]
MLSRSSYIKGCVTYKVLISKEGGKDCCNFLALETSLTTKVYWYLEPLTLNLVCLNGLPLALIFLLTLTTADLMSALLANSTNSLMSLISFCGC